MSTAAAYTIQDLRRLALDQGWTVEETANGHYRFVPKMKSKPAVVTSKSVQGRDGDNAIAQLKRSGLVIPGKTPPPLDLTSLAFAIDTVDKKLDLVVEDLNHFKDRHAQIMAEVNAKLAELADGSLGTVTAEMLAETQDTILALVDEKIEGLAAVKDPLADMRRRLLGAKP